MVLDYSQMEKSNSEISESFGSPDHVRGVTFFRSGQSMPSNHASTFISCHIDEARQIMVEK